MMEKLLIEQGHDVAVFASRYTLNLHSEWADYFPSEIDFSAPGLKNKLRAVTRLFYSREVKRRFSRLLDDFKPDIVHVHNIHSYLSPYVVKIAASRGIKVIWTLHDYKLICPSYSCLRDGKPCEACFSRKWNVVRHTCMKSDMKASVLAYLEARVWNRKVLEKYTHTFISPSRFLQSKMVSAGFLSSKIEVLHNFFPDTLPVAADTDKSDYYCYVGRLSSEKGIDLLLEVAEKLPYPLKVIGSGERLEEYKARYEGKPMVFLGQQSHEATLEIVRKARFSVLPSICYENNPLSIIESLCMGTPVLGADTGGIPELITEGINGFLFQPGNREMLEKQIGHCYRTFSGAFNFQRISDTARQAFSSRCYYDQLMRIYEINQ
ncbi:MAG: glycosyltransferase [Tannerellaceae bacterium]|jgi:glycosyltransferase involved in cell wall biosynthesis|nr:glycosyltransferase [Tannerellaceae bacterium]